MCDIIQTNQINIYPQLFCCNHNVCEHDAEIKFVVFAKQSAMSDSLFGKDMDTVFINDKTPWLTVKCRWCQSGHFQKLFYKSSRRFFDSTEIFHGFPCGIFLIPHHIYFRISNCHQDGASHALFWHFAFQMSHPLEAASNTF